MARALQGRRVKIARLAPDDAEAVRAVRLEALAAHPENFGTHHDDEAVHPIAWWQARLDSPLGVGFGAWIGGELARHRQLRPTAPRRSTAIRAASAVSMCVRPSAAAASATR